MTMLQLVPVPFRASAVGALCWLLAAGAVALQTPAPLERLDEPDREALESLATYPEPVREAALRASQHSDLLVEMSRLQDRSSHAFQDRIGGLDEELQKQIWELVRVPGLLTQLGDERALTDGELEQVAAEHPELEAAIWNFGRLHRELLVDLLAIHRDARERFAEMTSELPEADREAFFDLVEEPELVSMLTQRVRLAVYLGESYRDDPAATRAHLAALGDEVNARNTAAAEDWERSLEEDPEAAAELEAAQREYAEECDCDPAVRTEVVYQTRVIHAYPYWFGYPAYYSLHHLYPYGYWRPWSWYGYGPYYSAYYGYGFHLSFALPPAPFVHWFYDGHHHKRYSRAHHHLHRHHDKHPRARSHGHRAVRHWTSNHEGRPRHAVHRRLDGHRDRHGDVHRSRRGEVHRRHDGQRGSERAFFGHARRGERFDERRGGPDRRIARHDLRRDDRRPGRRGRAAELDRRGTRHREDARDRRDPRGEHIDEARRDGRQGGERARRGRQAPPGNERVRRGRPDAGEERARRGRPDAGEERARRGRSGDRRDRGDVARRRGGRDEESNVRVRVRERREGSNVHVRRGSERRGEGRASVKRSERRKAPTVAQRGERVSRRAPGPSRSKREMRAHRGSSRDYSLRAKRGKGARSHGPRGQGRAGRGQGRGRR